MSESGEQWWYDLKTKSVLQADRLGKSEDRLGPYRTREEAEQALATVERRNESWDNDPAWNDDQA